MGATTSGRRKLCELAKPSVGVSNASSGGDVATTNGLPPKEVSKKSWGQGTSVKFIPKCRIRYAKKVSKTMQGLMEEKFIRGFRKYGDRIEDKPLMNEILEEIIDLSNYYLTFAERAQALVGMAKNGSTKASTLRKNIIKLLT